MPARARRPAASGLTVAVTGPTGEIGKPFLAALEATPGVARVIGMARRPFDPASRGWEKTEYRRGDVLDRASVERLVDGADVVVHLAFIILGAGEDTRHINVEGSPNSFEAAAQAGAQRLVYASSVAAYGFPDVEGLIDEEMPAAGHERHPYSAHKAEVERVLDDALDGSDTGAYVFRPCIVAGPEAPLLVDSIPFVQLSERLPGAVRALFDQVPILKPVLPDPGVPFQLVHHDDVASALVKGVLGRGKPGAYNLAGPGEVTMRDLADALGWYTVPVPELAVDATAEVVARLPFLPEETTWIEALRRPVLMDTAKARRALRWRPEHDAHETLRQTVAGSREDLSASLR
jgi:UDP-glucose 4-epimerase